MDAKKFVKENHLENISIEIDGKKESILSILDRFQMPIYDKSMDLSNLIKSKQLFMAKNPMSPMTEMEYIRQIEQYEKTLSTLLSL